MIAGAIVFLLGVALVVVATRIPAVVFGGYLLLSLATFVAYAIDKSAARKRTRRIPENALNLLSLLGGWPGAIIAQQTLRHKTRKQPFRAIFWLTVVLNCAVFIGLIYPDGIGLLRALLTEIASLPDVKTGCCSVLKTTFVELAQLT